MWMRIHRVLERMAELGMREIELATALGETQQVVNNWKRRDVPRSRVLDIAKVLGVSPEYIDGGTPALTATEPAATYAGDSVEIPITNARGAAGHSAHNPDAHLIGSLTFKRRSLERRGLTASNLCTIYVDGDSMSPGICDGDVVMFDRSKTALKHGELYVLLYESDLLIKRVHKLSDGGLQLISDNTLDPRHAPRTIPAPHLAELQVLGQVVWRAGWY